MTSRRAARIATRTAVLGVSVVGTLAFAAPANAGITARIDKLPTGIEFAVENDGGGGSTAGFRATGRILGIRSASVGAPRENGLQVTFLLRVDPLPFSPNDGRDPSFTFSYPLGS